MTAPTAQEWICIKCGGEMEEKIIPIPGEGRVERIHACPRCGCTIPKGRL